MRQKCVKMGLVLLGKEERPKCVRNASKLRQKCVKNARNTFGGEHLLDDTEILHKTYVMRPGPLHEKNSQRQGWTCSRSLKHPLRRPLRCLRRPCETSLFGGCNGAFCWVHNKGRARRGTSLRGAARGPIRGTVRGTLRGA